MSLESFIAIRYLKSKKSHRFFSFLSFISFLGIFISVFSFVLIHSVMNGFSTYLKKALVGFNAHVTVSTTKDTDLDPLLQWIEQHPHVQFGEPVIEFHGIFRSPEGSAAGAKIRGIRNEDLKKNSSLHLLPFESGEVLLKDSGENMPVVLLGEDLYSKLQTFPESREDLSLILPLGDIGPTGEIEPIRKDFKIAGIMKTGFYEYDTQYALIAIDEARKLLRTDRDFTQILVHLKEGASSSQFKKELVSQFQNISVSTWEEKNQRLFHALKLERVGMFLLLSIVVFIACFNILGLMSLLAMSKAGDMAILYALGIKRKKIELVFQQLGAFLGLGGTLLGLTFGLGSAFWLKSHPLPLSPAYYLDTLPILLDTKVLILVTLMAPCFTILASLMPAREARKLNPIELLRET